MAVIKSISNAIKQEPSLLKALAYVTNPDKAKIITTENCYGNFEELAEQFKSVRIAHNKNNNILAHHFVQSFSPDDNITPEQAHKIGVALVQKIAPSYQVVLATHVDRDHIHNHFILNSVNPLTGYKWHDNKTTIRQIRKVSDELCREYGLSVIEKHDRKIGIDQITAQLAAKGRSWKVDLVKDLDEAVAVCRSKLEFIDYLNKHGYKVRYKDVHITITKIGEKKGIRVDTLARQFGDKYKKVNLEKAMGYFKEEAAPEFEKPQLLNKAHQPSYSNEWQRYEEFIFSSERKKEKLFSSAKTLPLEKFHVSNERHFLLRLILYIAIKFSKFFGRKNYERPKNKTYKITKEKIRSEKISETIPRTCGNIEREKLLNADGVNFRAEVNTLQLLKLSEADFFWTSRVNFKNCRAYVTVKECNAEKLSALIGVDVARLKNENATFVNQIIYGELKKQAENENTKLSFKLVSAEKVERLQSARIKFASFPKENGKVNIAFLPSEEEKIVSLIFEKSEKATAEKVETDFQRNARVNNEIKSAAALAGESPKYKVVSAEQIELLKNSGVKFAYFKNGEKFNTVFLRRDETRINTALATPPKSKNATL
jgi:hypothetical protein